MSGEVKTYKWPQRICADCGRPFRAKTHLKCKSCRRAEVRTLISEFKVHFGCVDCGYNEHAEALDFDHVFGNKQSDISRMVLDSRPLNIIIDEITKCEVVCANCHRIRTANRRKEKDEST